jgi:formylglycine-generating enzyme required for sulfatase activity
VESVSYSSIRGSAGWYDVPVASVSAKSFCGVLRAKTGLATLDLPTEAQWEYACRAGATGRFYWPAMTEATMGKWGRSKEGGVNLMIPGTNNQVPDLSVDTTYGTARVGSYPANPWGFYDMLGNLMDIVGDGNPWQNDSDYDASYTAIYTSPRVDPRGPPAHPDQPGNLTYSTLRTGRGADITMSNARLSTVYRRTIAPGNNARQWGVRIAVTED